MGPQPGPATPEKAPEKSIDILDEITADPGFINRGAGEAKEVVPAAVPVSGSGVAVPAADPNFDRLLATVQPIRLDRDGEHRVPDLNLLPTKEELAAIRKQLAALAAQQVAAGAPAAGATVAGSGPAGPAGAVAGQIPRRRSRAGLAVALLGLLILGGGGAAAYWFVLRPAPQVAIVTPTPSPIPSPSVTPTPSSTPSPTPSPTPSATPAPQTVTAPQVAPTAKNPQAVTITSKSGLWLRSSPTSVNRDNIIGWMPNGAQISVDQVGDFWWHGTYQGRPGYFASKYTQ